MNGRFISEIIEYSPPVEPGRRAEFLLDPEQLVVLRDAVGARGGAGLDLSGGGPTARSAIVVSSVSPDRWDTTAVHPARFAISIASIVSVTVPIWFSLMRTELATPFSIPFRRIEGLVTKMSSPTIWIFLPIASVNIFQPSQSSSEKPSSIETIGYWRQRSS